VKRLFLSVAVMALSFGQARAAIIGFDVFTLKISDAGTPPVLVDDETIQVTTGPNQRRSIWFNERQDISAFKASFTYRASSIGASGNRQGVALVIQDDAAGTNTLGDPIGGLFGNSGYGYIGIEPSAAVTIETDTGPGRTYTGFYTDGVLGGGSTVINPVNAFNFRDIDVEIEYDGSILSVTMTEGANVFPPRNYIVGSLTDIIGRSDAYVGFTASTANGGANQFLSNVRFNAPEPSSFVLAGLGVGALMLRRRTRMWFARCRLGAGGGT
jgi:hypothetical protein